MRATKLDQQDVFSVSIVAQIAELFAIDAQARDENTDFAARHALRIEWARLVLPELRVQIEPAKRPVLPSSPLARHPPTRFGCGTSSLAFSTNQSWN